MIGVLASIWLIMVLTMAFIWDMVEDAVKLKRKRKAVMKRHEERKRDEYEKKLRMGRCIRAYWDAIAEWECKSLRESD